MTCEHCYWGDDNRCPYCGSDYMAIEDDGQPDSYLARCWCGAGARVHKDDSDLAQALLPP